MILKERQVYSSRLENMEYKILVELPEKIEFSLNEADYGQILFWALKDLLDEADPEFEYVKSTTSSWENDFFLDENGVFKPFS